MSPKLSQRGQRQAYLDCYRKMLVISLFEEQVNALFLQAKITGTAHLCVGQEAVAVGACSALQPGDYVTSLDVRARKPL